VTALSAETLAKIFDFKSVDDFYVAIGCGDLGLGRIINRISEINAPKEEPIFPLTPREAKPSGNGVTVLGLKGLLTNMARCCNPAPGDEIVGYITRGRGATIHRQDCPNMLRIKDRERIIKVTWGEPHDVYPVAVAVKAYDRQGLMNDISQIITNEGVNLIDIDINVTHNLASINMVLEVSDIAQLSRVLTRIENLPNVMEAHRQHPG
jgi:GTP pyrophosphokinase